MQGSKKSSRLRILVAADELAHDLGPGNLSLDAVAQRAGVSKGGLLYHFPSKAKLLQALVQKHIDVFDGELAEQEKEHGGGENCLVEAYIGLVVAEFARRQPPASGVLAALAENPDLIAPIKQYNRVLLDRLKANAADENAALIVFLALEGLRSMKLFNVDVLTRQERDSVMAVLYAALR
jgi:AcrR family transcriptional regulator